MVKRMERLLPLQVQTLYFLRLVAKSENGEECTPEETQALKRLRELTRLVKDE